ncbi:MAG: metalloregulator ArsR/SmtB family transcription factor [Desulfovibrionaceae bacterium]|nr:metalloregulator ArsR/SmtB family transcription factor [Desulfovibrionaceae bacterium]
MSDTLRHLKALADETRLRLALVLQRYELSVNELVSLLGMGQSRVSRHLKILTEAGLLRARRDGLWVFYSAAGAGPHRDFLDAVLNFAGEEGRADLDMAARIIEERALKTRQFFNSIAEDWDELNRKVLGDFCLPDAVRRAVPAGCAIAVDLGCGTGEVLERLRDVSAQLIGVDGSPRMLELARRRFGRASGAEDARDEAALSLRIGELDHLPLRDAEADFACINLVLHHLSRPEAAIREMARVLRSGGLALVTDFDRHQDETMRSVYGDRWLGFTREELTDALAAAAFEPVDYRRRELKMGLSLHLVLARKRDGAL